MSPRSRPLRILVAQNVRHNLRGGMSRMLGFIHDRVAADGHQVEHFAAEQVPPAWSGRLGRLAFPLLVRRHARRAAAAGRPFDVINVHEPAAWAVVRARHALGDPLIAVTTHGVEARGWESQLDDARLGRERIGAKTRLVFPATVVGPSRFALRHADHIFCLNDDDRRYLLDRYGHAPDRITRMFPAADREYLDAFARRSYGAAPPRLLWFGTWLVRKGTPDLVTAFAALADRNPGLTLAVMGAGFPRETVLAAFPARLRARVDYVPPAPGDGHAAHAAEMIRASAYVLPSVFEGTPLTLMETMATGLVPVATAVCGIKDVIRHGENGLLVPPRDPERLVATLQRALDDRALRERLGRQAHADVAARYTWDIVSQPVRAVYRAMADRRARGGAHAPERFAGLEYSR